MINNMYLKIDFKLMELFMDLFVKRSYFKIQQPRLDCQ